MSQTTAKYRPSLTATQITFILNMVKERYMQYNSKEAKDIVKIFASLSAKIENNAIAPAFTSIPKESIENSLGIDAAPSVIYDKPINKVAFNLECYTLYIKCPEACNLVQLAAAKEHMYVNDLMSEKEEIEHESVYHATNSNHLGLQEPKE